MKAAEPVDRSALPLLLPQAQWLAVEAAYATPPRAYHNFDHVQELLRRFLLIHHGPGWLQPREVCLAMLYHDAIYEAGRRDNEARSAQLALEHISQWLPDADIDARCVSELIMLTARHGELDPDELDRDAALFLDCDMAIVGADADTFAAYDRAIAAEFRGQVPGWLYRINRRRFLKSLLGRRRIFHSSFFHERLDGQARHNLRMAVTSKR